ncbi:MAG: hypothetical protein ACQEXQ_24325 [Bacillota bacterium]
MIRMKVKTLILLLAFLLLTAWIGYFSLPSLLYNAGKYDALFKWFPGDERAESALYLSAEAAMQFSSSAGDEHIFIFPSSSSSSGSGSTKEERQFAQSRLEDLLHKYSTSRYINGAKFSLAKLYMWNKEWDKADRLFSELASTANTFYAVEELQAYRSMLNTRNAIPEKQAALTGKVTIGDKPAADVFVVLHRKDDNGWYSPPYSHYPVAITDEHGVYRFYDIEASDYEVGVGLTPAEISGFYLTQSAQQYVGIAEGKTAVYDIRFVPQVTVVSPVNKEQIAGNKLRFEWQAYPGAEYYQLSITTINRNKEGKTIGSNTVPLSEEHFQGTTAEYTLKELRGYRSGLSKSMDAEGNVTLSNTGVLGAIFPGGDFIWSVDAYDAKGLKLSSSSGYYTMLVNTAPLFTLSEEGMLEGDRLVIKGEYEKAIQAYRSEGDNDNALRALARLTYYGITKEDGDPAEALIYLQRISVPNESDKDLMKQAQEELARE